MLLYHAFKKGGGGLPTIYLLFQFLVFCGFRATCGSGFLSFQKKCNYLGKREKDMGMVSTDLN